MHLKCGHSFCLGCIGKHVDTQCKQARARVDGDLRASDEDMNLAGDEQSLLTLHTQGRIRRCPRSECGYGPVINSHCDDLQAHDSHRGRGTGRTTNSCPVCGFFSNSWTDWAEWLPTNPTVAARCPVCRGCCCALASDVEMLGALLRKLDERLEEWDGVEALHIRVAEDISRVASLLQRDVGAGGRDREAVHVSPSQARVLLTGPLVDFLQRRLELERPAYLRALALDFEQPHDLNRRIIAAVHAADNVEIDSEHARLAEKRCHARLLLQAAEQDGSRINTLDNGASVDPGRSPRRQRVFNGVVDNFDGRSHEEVSCFFGVILRVCPRCAGRIRRNGFVGHRPILRRSRSLPSRASGDWIPPDALSLAETASSEVGSSLRELLVLLHNLRTNDAPH